MAQKKGNKKKNKSGGGASRQRANNAAAAGAVDAAVAQAQAAEVADPQYVMFKGGPAIILKCPAHKYESTIAFYRDILGLATEQCNGNLSRVDWGHGMWLYVTRTERLTHPAVWLTVDCNNPTVARRVLGKRATIRDDIELWDSEHPDEFWASPPNDMIHLIKRPGHFAATGCKQEAHRQAPSPTGSAQGGDHADDDGANPLNVGAASHAPTGQKGKLTDCSFSGGRNIALKCPPPKYESTVAFYRETLGMEVVHYCRSCCKLRWNEQMYMWIDCVDTCSTVTWLEIATASTPAARAYLKGRKKVSLRPEVEVLPPGVDGFWVSPPNDMVHLIRGPDGRDEAALPVGELAEVPFKTAAQLYLEEAHQDAPAPDAAPEEPVAEAAAAPAPCDAGTA